MTSPTPVSSIPECIKTIEPDSNGWVPPGTCGYYGKMYYPSFTQAAIFSALAGVMLLGHLVQAIRYPKSGLQRFAVFVSICLFAGYVARTVGTRHQQNIYIAAFSDTMVLVSPILVTGFDCMLFVNVVQLYRPDKRIWGITSRAMSWAAIIIIPLLTIVALVTCAMIVTGNPGRTQQSGIRIYIGIIGIQEVLVVCLVGLIVKFHSTMNKSKNSKPLNKKWVKWQVITFALYLSLGAIIVRTTYRLIELSQVFQANKSLPHKEIFFYGFEAIPVLTALSVWAVVTTGNLTQPTSRKTDYEYQQVHEPASEETIHLMTAQAQESNGPS